MQNVVYSPMPLADYITHILDFHTTPTFLVVCSEKQVFLENLEQSIESLQSSQEGNKPLSTHPIRIPTSRILIRSETIKLAFCPSVEVLRAYLSTVTHKSLPPLGDSMMEVWSTSTTGRRPLEPPTLALLNPLKLHRSSMLFSAQGISETFAAAVDAAARSRMRLAIVETNDRSQSVAVTMGHRDELTTQSKTGTSSHENSAQEQTAQDQGRECISGNAWDEQVPILNSTTKIFGQGNDRAVIRGAVRLSDIAKRWCCFKDFATG